MRHKKPACGGDSPHSLACGYARISASEFVHAVMVNLAQFQLIKGEKDRNEKTGVQALEVKLLGWQ